MGKANSLSKSASLSSSPTNFSFRNRPKFLNNCCTHPAKANFTQQLIFDNTCTHTTAQLKRRLEKQMGWVDPLWCQRYESERSTLPLLAGSEWIMDLIKTISRVAMKWKLVINAKCDAALSRLLDWSQFCNQTILANFGKREKMQNCLHCSLTSKKNSKCGLQP